MKGCYGLFSQGFFFPISGKPYVFFVRQWASPHQTNNLTLEIIVRLNDFQKVGYAAQNSVKLVGVDLIVFKERIKRMMRDF